MTEPHYTGHRARLRERFFTSLNNSGESNLPDYEILELLLCAAVPRGDMKPLAKMLVTEFGSLAGVLCARKEELSVVKGMGDAAVAVIKTVRAASTRMIEAPLMEKTVLSNWQAVIDYCQITMAQNKVEQFRIFFLDTKNNLIANELQQQGTVDHTPVYPREVVKRALELSASSLILVHNHPTGDTKPSNADIEMTRQLMQATAQLGIIIHDHIIIGARDKHFSFSSNGLL